MTSVNLVETTERPTDQILRAYQEVLLEAGYDPADHEDDRVEVFIPLMAEAAVADEAADPQTRRLSAEVSAAEARYHEALLLGRAAAPEQNR